MKAQESNVEAQIVVKDKHGNVKYQGPLVMTAKTEKEKEDVGNSQHGGEKRSG